MHYTVSIAHFLLSNINFYCAVRMHVYVVSHFYYCSGHFRWKWICECLFLLFVLYVLSFCLFTVVGEAIIQRSWDPINMFNPDTFLCLSQYRSWISNATSWGFFCVQLFVLLILVELLTPHWLNFLFWSLKPRKVDVTQ